MQTIFGEARLLADSGALEVKPMQTTFAVTCLLADTRAIEDKFMQNIFGSRADLEERKVMWMPMILVGARLLSITKMEVMPMQEISIETRLLADSGEMEVNPRQNMCLEGMTKITTMQSRTNSTSGAAAKTLRRGYCLTSFGATFVRTCRTGWTERSAR